MGIHVSRFNFKACHVATKNGPYFAVDISSFRLKTDASNKADVSQIF